MHREPEAFWLLEARTCCSLVATVADGVVGVTNCVSGCGIWRPLVGVMSSRSVRRDSGISTVRRWHSHVLDIYSIVLQICVLPATKTRLSWVPTDSTSSGWVDRICLRCSRAFRHRDARASEYHVWVLRSAFPRCQHEGNASLTPASLAVPIASLDRC